MHKGAPEDERKMKFRNALLALTFAAAAATPAFAITANCPQCRMIGVREEPVIGGNLATIALGLNLSRGFLPATPRLEFAQSMAPLIPPTAVNWAPGMDLPGAFVRPWEWPSTSFDPTFHAPVFEPMATPFNLFAPANRPWQFAFSGPRPLS
jgi:hypothetical protein